MAFRVVARKRFYKKKAGQKFWSDVWEATWEGIYGTPEQLKKAEDGFRAHPTYLVLKRLMPAGGKVLEAGCGLGLWVRLLAREGHSIVGMDLSDGTLKRLYDLFPEFMLCAGNVLALPFRNCSFDACLSFGVIEHFYEGPVMVLRETYRLLKPGGLFFCSVPYLNPIRLLARVWDVWYEHRLNRSPNHEFYQYAYSVPELSRFMRQTGFQILEVHPQSVHMFLIGWRPFRVLFNILYRLLKGKAVDWQATRPASLPKIVGSVRSQNTPLQARLEKILKTIVQWEPLAWVAGHQVLIVARKPDMAGRE